MLHAISTIFQQINSRLIESSILKTNLYVLRRQVQIITKDIYKKHYIWEGDMQILFALLTHQKKKSFPRIIKHIPIRFKPLLFPFHHHQLFQSYLYVVDAGSVVTKNLSLRFFYPGPTPSPCYKQDQLLCDIHTNSNILLIVFTIN